MHASMTVHVVPTAHVHNGYNIDICDYNSVCILTCLCGELVCACVCVVMCALLAMSDLMISPYYIYTMHILPLTTITLTPHPLGL